MSADRGSDDAQRVAELMRVNAELAAELRSLTLERANTPRSSVLPAARRVARAAAEQESLSEQLDTARAQLDAISVELEAARARQQELYHQNQELGRHAHELAQEVGRLRAGAMGVLRRARARILRH